MISFKAGVRIDFASPAMQRLVITLAQLARQERVDFVITSANDSRHLVDSRHYTNEAIDIRSKSFPTAVKRRLREVYEAMLGPQFRVLLEVEGTDNEHFHAQVRRGAVYVTGVQT
jgi:hypothetical protein